MSKWAVVFRRGRASDVWAILEEVPAELDELAIGEALESWPRWPSWRARAGLSGTITLVPERRWRRVKATAELRDHPTELTAIKWPSIMPEQRTLSVPLEGALYSRVSHAAMLRGQSLRAFAVEVLEAATRPPSDSERAIADGRIAAARRAGVKVPAVELAEGDR